MEEDGAARSTRGGAANSFLKSRDLQEHLRFKYGVELCTPTRPQICKNWERKARNSCKWCWFPQQGPVRIQPAALAGGGGWIRRPHPTVPQERRASPERTQRLARLTGLSSRRARAGSGRGSARASLVCAGSVQ